MLDKFLNVLACTEQYQFWNPSLSPDPSQQCTPLVGLDHFTEDGYYINGSQNSPLFTNQLQQSIMSLLHQASFLSSFYFVITSLGNALLADKLAQAASSLPLPNDQWIREAENRSSISMANMQRYMVNTTTGPPGNDAQCTNGQANSNSGLAQFCENQIIQRQDFTNLAVSVSWH